MEETAGKSCLKAQATWQRPAATPTVQAAMANIHIKRKKKSQETHIRNTDMSKKKKHISKEEWKKAIFYTIYYVSMNWWNARAVFVQKLFSIQCVIYEMNLKGLAACMIASA